MKNFSNKIPADTEVGASQKELKNLGEFAVEPEYAYLWDRCVYELLYDPEKFVKEFCLLLEKYGVDKSSKILDTCAGSGFPALDMYKAGYEGVYCVDGSDDQIRLFNSKAQAENLDIRSEKCDWSELLEHFKPEQFKALICKGSIWYAEGGWNKDFVPNRDKALKALKDTLSKFYALLEVGGALYLDKFRDSEVDHKDAVGVFKVNGVEKELMFYTHREREAGIRRAQMIIKDVETGAEGGLPNVTYDLKESELEQILVEVGFSIIKPELSEEKFFTSWLAIKN